MNQTKKIHSCFDIAKYILQKRGPTITTKLHILLYYCQGWSLAWDNKRLFKERIKAGPTGPIIPTLYKTHTGKSELTYSNKIFTYYKASKIEDMSSLDTIDAIIEGYGDSNIEVLTDLVKSEDPWKIAHAGPVAKNFISTRSITLKSLKSYFKTLWALQEHQKFLIQLSD